MTKRTVRRYLIACLAGALLSCATAWALALSRGSLIRSADDTRVGLFDEPLGRLNVMEARILGITQVSIWVYPPDGQPMFSEVRDALLHVPRVERCPPLAPTLSPGGVQVDTTFGVPFRCLASRSVVTPGGPAQTTGWQLGGPTGPLLPILPKFGLAMNAIVFGVLPLLVFDGWRRRRASGRAERGLCPGCGYALTPRTPVCPECGGGGSLRSQRVENRE